jgi:phage-related protein
VTAPVFGEGQIHLITDIEEFKRKLKRELEDAARDADDASSKVGDGAGRSFNTAFIGQIGSLGASLAGTLAKATAAIGSLGAAGSAISGLTTIVGSLGGALALIPAGVVAAQVAINTLRLGVQGFSDAVSETDPEKFAELAEKLAPSARAAVIEVRNLADAWEEMQNAIQQELFEDTAGIISRLGNTFIPILRTELSGIASDFNEAGTQTANFVLRGTQVETVRDILQNSREAVGNLSTSMSALAQIFLDVVAVGSEFLPGLSDGFNGAAQRAADFVNSARETGELKAFIQEALDTLKQLGDVFQNIGRIIDAVFDAFDAAGAGALDTLVRLTDTVADFLESFEGQQILQVVAEALKTISGVAGTVLKAALDALGPVLVDLLPLFAQIAELAGGVLAEAITLLVPIIAELVKVIAPLIPPILELISQLLPPLAELLNALLPIITAVIDILIAVVPPLAAIAENVINMLIPAIEFMAEVITRVGGVVRDVLTFVANTFVSVHTRISNIVSGAWRVIRDVVFNTGSAVLNAVRTAFNNVVSAIGTALGRARDAVGNGLAAVVRFFRDLPGKIVSAIGNIAGRLFEIGQNMIQGLIDGLVSLAQNVLNFFIDLVDRAIGGVLRFLGIASPSKLMRDIGHDTGAGLIQGLRDMISPTEDTARMLAAAAAGAVGSVTNQFSPFTGSAALGGLTGAGGVSGGTTTVSPSFVVDVRIGETQLTEIMDVRIREREREIRRRTPLRGRL